MDELREVLAGRRGRLLVALLIGEFGAAMTGTAYSSVLPVASAELHGAALYGATVVSANFATLLVLTTGVGSLGRISQRHARRAALRLRSGCVGADSPHSRPALAPTRRVLGLHWRRLGELRARGCLLVATLLFLVGVALSAGAPSMWFVLVGMVVRGLAAGVLAGFELTAVGALYDDRLRPRVVGLFAICWLLPSLVGPVANSLLTLAVSWRLALAWPAVLVVGSRVLIGRDADLVPWGGGAGRSLEFTPALGLLGALVAAACAPAVTGPGGVLMLVGGVLAAAALSVRVLARRLGGDHARLALMVVFALLCLTFFGGHQLASLAAIEGLGYGVATAAVTVGAAQIAWSLLGLRGATPLRPDARILGLVLVAAALAVVGLALVGGVGGVSGRVALIGGWTVGGIGMGLAYRELFSDAVAGLPAERVEPAAVALTFAELAATTIGSLAVGGWYSLGHVDGVAPRWTLGSAYLCLAAVAAATSVLVVRRRLLVCDPSDPDGRVSAAHTAPPCG